MFRSSYIFGILRLEFVEFVKGLDLECKKIKLIDNIKVFFWMFRLNNGKVIYWDVKDLKGIRFEIWEWMKSLRLDTLSGDIM